MDPDIFCRLVHFNLLLENYPKGESLYVSRNFVCFFPFSFSVEYQLIKIHASTGKCIVCALYSCLENVIVHQCSRGSRFTRIKPGNSLTSGNHVIFESKPFFSRPAEILCVIRTQYHLFSATAWFRMLWWRHKVSVKKCWQQSQIPPPPLPIPSWIFFLLLELSTLSSLVFQKFGGQWLS